MQLDGKLAMVGWLGRPVEDFVREEAAQRFLGGPTGVGKTTVLRKLQDCVPGVAIRFCPWPPA